MNINEYLKSGVLEDYISGSLNEAEIERLLHLKTIYPEIDAALYRIDVDLAELRESKPIPPPPGLWTRIDDNLHELAKTEEEGLPGAKPVEIEDTSKHMRVKKLWKWRIIGILILMGLLVGLVIYLYKENQQMKEQLENQAVY
ncbi:hypothetical protein [Pedobacter heparinus]|uniref:Uncharacterized protein n=1 Tax=Pedobacter heparinus (strain ATCC 13125 / DSM 2366 / CIP 104194 / JCM 7457 / NBRC 12017 / NCIMB 9290 / NRRL B-14731 / HIM 762-3) TaxID=485917 RepID=C6XUM6_PEDHD|nr:hypothetical protein [Pedobacter heparinus]ACU03876.1 hypothetical protein Phep_1665 [Pedobacter heparinus DSM 2366]